MPGPWANNCEPGWVAEVLRMTLLAPDIIRAVVEGRQPRHLNLHAVRGRQEEIPLDWEEQRKLFGFSLPSAHAVQRYACEGLAK